MAPNLTRRGVLSTLAGAATALANRVAGAQSPGAWRDLPPGEAPPDNPLKGLVPYASSSHRARFPHSLEFEYLPFAELAPAPARYDWRKLDRLLDAIAGRGNQAIFRVFLEYPGRKSAVPAWLREAGLRVERWSMDGSNDPEQIVETPDYADRRLIDASVAFVDALGARYDGDPRIGFVHAGLLGIWGEWHNWPRADLYPSKRAQRAVMDAYARALPRTRVLLRYPAGSGDAQYVENSAEPFGYHDDSFAWSTLPTTDWHFVALLRRARAQDKWRTHPIGGEIRPEAWGKVFDADPGDPEIEDFDACVAQTHASWLMDSGMFAPGNPPARVARAILAARSLGYTLRVRQAALSARDGSASIAVRIVNDGVAPFYAAWPLEFALLDAAGGMARQVRTDLSVANILPGAEALRGHSFAVADLPAGRYRAALRVANPLANGKPLRFANADQDRDVAGWLTLGELTLGG